MKIKKKYIAFKSGFIRFKYLEINWRINDWALPLAIDINKYLIFIRLFCVSFILTRYPN